MAKLEARGVGAEYLLPRSGKHLSVLENVNLDVQSGEFVSIVGPSGCGKTTFLNVVDGAHPLRVGSIRLDGKEISGPGRDRAMVFQSPSLLPWRTVKDNIIYGLELQGRKKDPAAKATVAQLIKMVGLSGFEHGYPSEQSGDPETQIAQAFVNMQGIVEAAGGTLDGIGKVTVYLKDFDHRRLVNKYWLAMFPDEQDRPARHVLKADLQAGDWVQLDVIASM